jgi:RHS repeat-associated protein
VTTYTYDSLGNRITETDANGRTTRYEHDLLGRPIRKTLPGGEVMSAEFDPMGNMVRRVDYNGQVSTYAYDSNGKLTTINLPGGVVERATWTATGKRSTVTDARGVTRWTYDSMDRVSSRLDPNGEEVRWEYDASGNRTVVVTPVGTTRYAYDALNRLTTVTDPDGGVTRYTYHVTGTRASLTQANGLVTSYEYDENRRLVGMETHDGAVLVAGYRYTLDAGGRRIALEELHTDTTVDWVYDDLSRLVSETWNDGRVITYTYDTVGNRLTRNDSVDGATAYVYDENDRLVTAGDLAYEYDANGNPTTIGDSTYVYDPRDRLVQVESAEETVTYEYDVDGHRIGRVVDRAGALEETRYLVDENRRYTEVFAELDGAGNVNVRYVYGADLLSQHRGNDARYYVQDGQMSVRHLADGAGTITDSYDYDAFGNVLFQEGETPNDLLYNSQFFDPNSGFYYLRARWLDPETGRFLTVDPAEGLLHDPRTLHRYTYALNSPIDHADPSGRFTMVSISISLTINSSLQSIYTTNLVRFFLKATRIAICQLAPAYAAQNAAMEGIMNDTPGSYQLYEASRMMIAEGFRAIGGAIVETYQNIVNELIDFKFEINVDLNAAIDALQEQLGPGFGGFNEGVDNVQGILDAIEQLEKWKEKINEYIDTAKDWYNTVAAIIDDTATACDKAKAWEKVGNKLLDFVPSF